MNITELPAPITQVDAAAVLVELYRNNLRYSPAAQKWLTFNDAEGWAWDSYAHRVQRLVVETLERLRDTKPDGLDIAKLRRFLRTRESSVRALQTNGAINGIVKMAATHSAIHCDARVIDADTHLMGTNGGVVDLRNGTVQPFNRDQIITRRVDTAFNPAATCERWERFLREVLGDDDDVQSYFHQLVGYTLTGETSQHQMWLMVGNGSNGKSSLLRVLKQLLGSDYAQQAPESVLLGRANTSGASSDLVRLKGVRCALLTETGHGESFNEERVKALVAADTVAARGLYREFEEFDPQAKFFLATNHLPVVRGTDKGIWRRLVVVPFDKEFEVGGDATLHQDLVDELPGIFAWAVRGAVRWYDKSQSFVVPTAWSTATNNYRTEQDPLQGFLDERVVVNPASSVGATELWDDYLAWCGAEGVRSLSRNEFSPRMVATGLVTKGLESKTRRKCYLGIALRTAAAEAEIGAKVERLFDVHTAPPTGPSLISPDSPVMEVTP